MDAASTPTPAPEPEGVQAPSAAEGDGQECPWCRFMKAGPCGEVFSAWQSCVDDAGDVADAEGRKQAINTCAAVSKPLWECMTDHPDYYASQLPNGAASRGEQPPGSAQSAAEAAAHVDGGSRSSDASDQAAAATQPAPAGAAL